ncbi:MAG: metal-sensitive transcriptional regulator [Candidatus Colwellbacteria bacterium]|nr:metal-sensitive transcriptional regulator [Candidatus Colwellbacteria bacterium]
MVTKTQGRALRRLKIIGGQIHGLQKMVEDDRYCPDIIIQSLAIKKALSSFEDFIFENHIATHAVEQIKGQKSKKAVKEIIAIYKLSK